MTIKKEIENPMVLSKFIHNREVYDLELNYFLTEDHEIRCQVCGALQYMEEAIESEMWEDQYICDEKECIEKHHTGWAESMNMQKYYRKQK